MSNGSQARAAGAVLVHPVIPTAAAFDPDRPQELMSVPQIDALSTLMEGQSITQAAESAGVTRCTVTRWLKFAPAFRAAYNAWRQEMIESARARLLRAAHTAAGVVLKAIEEGDAKLAFALLRQMKLADPVPVGSPNIALAADEIAVDTAEEYERLHNRARMSNALQIADSVRSHSNDGLHLPPVAPPPAPGSPKR